MKTQIERLWPSILGSILLLVAVAFVMPCLAQQTTGTLGGRILDQTGGVIPGAEIELTKTDTNASTKLTTGDDGNYVFNFVQPGTYQLRVAMPGFKTHQINGILVQVNKNTGIDVVLETGELSQTIEVRASADTIEARSAVVSTNIASRQLTELPLSSRNALEIAELAPGVSVDSGSLTGGSQVLGRDGVAANVNGARRQQNSFYLDGTDNSGAYRNLGLQMPNPEAVEEVQVTTSTNSAEFGKQPGGYFNVITKSGTNQFHGSAYYFGTAQQLNANEWVRNKNNLDRTPANRKQFGGTIGGPVIKDKTFFFASFQQYRDEATSTYSTVRFPTTKMLAGDFSEYTGKLYLPGTTQQITNNNLIPYLNPVAVNIAKSGLIPTVAKLGDRLVWEFVQPPRNNEILGKVDHDLTANQRLQGSYFQTWGETSNRGGDIPNYSTGFVEARQLTTSLRHTWTLSGNVIIESRFSRAKLYNNQDTEKDLVGQDWSDFGAKWPNRFEGATKYRPWMEIRDGFSGTTFPRSEFDQLNYRAGSTASWVKGAHNIKFGYEAQRSRVDEAAEKVNNGFRFQGRFTNQGKQPSGSVPNALFAHSMADFMLGRIENFAAHGLIDYSVHAWSHYAFIQDQWRITPRFTLTPGLRYEFYEPWDEKDGKASAFVANHQSSRFPNAPLHVAFQGDNGIPGGFVEPDRNNFAPRIGAAYDVFGDGKLAVRGGYGLYYAYPGAQMRIWTCTEGFMVPQNQGAEAILTDPWGTSINPVFTTPPTPYPSDINEYLSTYVFALPSTRNIGFDPEFTTPMSHQWNITAERELTPGVIVSGGYVANRGRKLLQTLAYNYARWMDVNGQPPSDNINNIMARVPYPTMNRFSILAVSEGVIDYDSFQISTRVNRNGLTGTAYYAFADSFGDGGGSFGRPDEDPEAFTIQTNNAANPKAEYGRIARKHTFRTFYVYDLPWLKGNSGVLGMLAGGWKLSGNFSYYSGSPFDVILGFDANHDGITSQPRDRPDLVGDIRYTTGSRVERMASFFDKSSFAIPTISANNLMGNLQRNALIGPSSWYSDLGVAKDFRIDEDKRVQFRLEVYNWLNHPNMGSPNGQMNSADFGKILTLSGNRTMQYGLKFYF